MQNIDGRDFLGKICCRWREEFKRNLKTRSEQNMKKILPKLVQNLTKKSGISLN